MKVSRLLLTRGWIVLLSTLLVMAVALGIRELKPPGYTGEAVLVVPANSGAVNPGSADQAAKLADTYQRLIPQNRELLRSVANGTSLSSQDVRGALTVSRRGNDALLEIAFVARNRRVAIAGANAVGEALGQGAPGIPAQGITVVSRAQTATRVSGARPRFRASTTVLVSSGSGGPGPGNADQANKLATTFAGLIPNDQEILRSVGDRVHRSTAAVGARLTVVNDADTSLLRIRYKGADPKEARLGARLVAEAVAGPVPVAGAIPSRSLKLVRLPTTTSSVYSIEVLLGVAAVLGFALGLLLLVVLERADPRLRDPRAAADLLRTPAISARRLTREAATFLVREWTEVAVRAGRASDGQPPTVALIPASKAAVPAAQDLAVRLMGASGATSEASRTEPDGTTAAGVARQKGRGDGNVGIAEREAPAAVEPPLGSREGSVVVVAFDRDERDHHRKGDAGLDVAAIVRHDVLVLVIASETRARRVSATVDVLAEFGRASDSAILVGRKTSDLPPG